MLKVYVDGTVYNGQYGGGYVVMDGSEIVHQDCGCGGNNPELLAMRNISGEITAAMHGTLWLHKNNKKGVIVHDYIGLSKWVTGEWKTNKAYTYKYAEWMRPFYQNGTITFEWVKGHTGVEGNEIADKLARQSVVCNQQWKD